MLNDLDELLTIESLQSEPQPGAPFGLKLKETLELFLKKAKGYGLRTKNVDGYCGYAEYGDGEDIIGILCHLDTVPVGIGWSVPPYRLTNLDGYLYGRGVVDDKGPAVIILHVLKALREKNVKLNKRVRLIVGLNEENGSECLKYYALHEQIPSFSITPDSDFPVINSEKGVLRLNITVPLENELSDSVLSLKFGNAANIVPNTADCLLKKESAAAKKLLNGDALKTALAGIGIDPSSVSTSFTEAGLALTANGTAGHAMAPDKADNADAQKTEKKAAAKKPTAKKNAEAAE